MARRNKIRTITGVCVISAAVFITCMLQMSVLPYLKISGCIPNAVCAFLICMSVAYEGKVACVCAVAAGFILQASGSGGVSYYPLLCLAAACASPLLHRRVFRNTLVAALVSGLCVFITEGVILTLIAAANGCGVWYALSHTFIPFVLYSMICILPGYLYCRLHNAIFGARRITDIEA